MLSLPTDNKLKILLLGGFSAQINDSQVIGFSYNKMRALLAYLAVEQGKDHSREFLSELLWNDYEPATARHNLRRALSNLRRLLEAPTGCPLFAVTHHTIRFAPDVYVDTLEFTGQTPTQQDNCDAAIHREERLVTLYKGEFLRGLSLPDCPDFEDWIQMQRETLHLRALSLLEKLSNHYAQISDYSKALQFTLRHTDLEPWDENAHHRAMRLYLLNGQSSAAINQYKICCRLLKNELNVLPNEKIRQLIESIRNGQLRRRSIDTVVKVSPPQTLPSPATERRSSERRGIKRLYAASSERRQVSVLYCELIMGAIDDPDEAIALLRAPQARCTKIIRQFSGHIVQAYGGGLIAYFGYPQAHEHAAHGAVRAALAITCKTSLNIKIRASIHTGLIVCGDASMPDMTGSTSMLAIQLRSSVSCGQVAISKDTHAIVQGHFDCTSLGIQAFPDFGRTLEIFKVAQERRAHTRLDTTVK